MTRKKKMRWPTVGIMFGLVAVFVLGACSATPEAVPEGEGTEESTDVIFLDTIARRAAELELTAVESLYVTELLATGIIGFDQNAVSRIGPRTEGRVVRVPSDLGAHVYPGDTLVVLESPDLGEAQGAYDRARVETDLTKENYDREQNLFREQITSRKEFLEARAAFESASAELRVTERRLRTLGATPGVGGAYFTAASPIEGEVVYRDVVPGQIAGPDDHLFTVADLDRLWLIVDVYEKDLGRLQEGQRVELGTPAFPDTTFSGRVAHVGQIVESSTHTLKVRVIIQNPDHKLRPGMFARAAIQVKEPVGLPVVPERAVQDVEGKRVVFIPEGDGDRFRMVEVKVGPTVQGDLLALLAGVDTGQIIVGRGAFYLKSQLLKSTFADEG
jgi:cobalt-zinc-cadmium efflux system membrane fusion protein